MCNYDFDPPAARRDASPEKSGDLNPTGTYPRRVNPLGGQVRVICVIFGYCLSVGQSVHEKAGIPASIRERLFLANLRQKGNRSG